MAKTDDQPDGAHVVLQRPCYASYVAGLECAAQIVRYYLKHQNQPSDWDGMSEYERGVSVTSENLDKIIREESELPESESRFSDA